MLILGKYTIKRIAKTLQCVNVYMFVPACKVRAVLTIHYPLYSTARAFTTCAACALLTT